MSLPPWPEHAAALEFEVHQDVSLRVRRNGEVWLHVGLEQARHLPDLSKLEDALEVAGEVSRRQRGET